MPVQDMKEFLAAKGLEAYVDALASQGFSQPEDFFELSERDVEELGSRAGMVTWCWR